MAASAGGNSDRLGLDRLVGSGLVAHRLSPLKPVSHGQPGLLGSQAAVSHIGENGGLGLAGALVGAGEIEITGERHGMLPIDKINPGLRRRSFSIPSATASPIEEVEKNDYKLL